MQATSVPDTAALLQRALQTSWQRDHQIRAWRLSWRWSTWWLTRYGTSFIAAALVSASTPKPVGFPDQTPLSIDALPLKPSLNITLPP